MAHPAAGVGYSVISARNGGKGGDSGKAVTFVTVPAGTVLDVTVGAKGTGGTGPSSATSVSPFTTPGATTWTVPGVGSVEVEITANGAGGGGSGGFEFLNEADCSTQTPHNGDVGGAGGQGITKLTLAAGTVLDISIGSGGAGSAAGYYGGPCGESFAADASGGGNTVVSISGVVKAQGNAGGGAHSWDTSFNHWAGSAGGGSGDSVSTGGGAGGGAAGASSGCSASHPIGCPGGTGGNGSVTIRYSDANPGTAGSLSKVEIAGVLKAQGDGGGGGSPGHDGGTAGTAGGATGDQTFTGGAWTGGTGGIAGTPNGSDGQAGRVEIRY